MTEKIKKWYKDFTKKTSDMTTTELETEIKQNKNLCLIEAVCGFVLGISGLLFAAILNDMTIFFQGLSLMTLLFAGATISLLSIHEVKTELRFRSLVK